MTEDDGGGGYWGVSVTEDDGGGGYWGVSMTEDGGEQWGVMCQHD